MSEGLLDIGVGDVVLDAARNQALQVVDMDHRTAAEHPHVEIDALHAEWGVTPEDAVYDCVFLPAGDDAVSTPSKTYAYPEGRLIRYPVEHATAAMEPGLPPRDELVLDTLAVLIAQADRDDDEFDHDPGRRRAAVIAAARGADLPVASDPQALVDHAEELARAIDQSAADGGGGDGA